MRRNWARWSAGFVAVVFACPVFAAMPALDWGLGDAARERTATRERVCLNGWWQFHLGDKPVRPVADAPQGKALAVLDDLEGGVGAFDPRASEGAEKPKVQAAKEAKFGQGAMHVAVAPRKEGWRTLTRAVKLPEGEFALSVWVKGLRGKVRLRLRLLERRKDGFEIHCTEPVTVTPGEWGKLTCSLLQMPYLWGSGATNDKTLQLANVNEFDFLFELDSDGELLVDQLQLEPLGDAHPAIPDDGWGAAQVPGRIFPGECQCHLPDGKLLDLPEQKLPTTGWYRRQLDAPAAWRGKRLLLDVGHVNQRGFVFLNGCLLGEANQVLDVTSHVRAGQPNTLDLYSRSTRIGTNWWSRMDWTAGVYGDVWLEARDSPVNVRDVRIITSVEQGELSADIEVENGTDGQAEVEVAARADESLPPAGAAPGSSCDLPGVKATIPAHGRATARLSAKWANPKLWSPDTPHLYSLRVQVRGKGLLDECVERFGFREFAARKGRFYLNGAPFFFRSETAGLDGIGLYTGYNRDSLRRYLLFLRGMHYNGSGFGIGRGLSMEKFAEACDEVGFVWLPGWDSWSPAAWRKLKNHPSLVGWSTDTWVTLQKWDNQPRKLGTDYFPEWLLDKRKQMLEHEAEIKRLDPTRIVLHYGCGNVGDIWCNLPYMGFGVPLQAREEVPRDWSARKLEALYSAEFDFPFMYNWRDVDSYERQQFMWDATRYKAGLHHEHAARYFGEAAYAMSKRLHPSWSDGRDEGGDLAEMVARVNRLFVERNLRAWRAYEVSGLGLFGLTTGGYAHVVTDFSKRQDPEAKWGSLKTPDPKPHQLRVNVPITDLNEVGQAVRDALSPLLAFIGGHPDFVTKDHAFFSGERIEKQAVLVSGSATDADVAVEWWLTDEAGKELLRKQATVPLPAGGVKMLPIALEPLDVKQRAGLDLHLRARGAIRWLDVAPDGQRRETRRGVESADAFHLEILPRERPALPEARAALFDPSGATAKALDAMGLKAARLEGLRGLSGYGLLILGRGALDAGAETTEVLKAVRAGLNVVCFEQTPDGLLGEQLVQADTRRAFATIPDHPVLAGLRPEDLADWRGASDLCEAYPEPAPETERTYPEAYWHWSNNGTVCTYALRRPALGNARALLSCWFDLSASPLLECVEGKGRILFCQLDVTSRYGTDPVATKLVNNLVHYAAMAKPAEERPLCALKSERIEKLLGWLGFGATLLAADALGGIPQGSVLLLDASALGEAHRDALAAFVRKGGRALVLAPPSAKAVQAWQGDQRARLTEVRDPRSPERPAWLPAEVPLVAGDARVGRSLLKHGPSLLAGLGNGDFFWRQAYPVTRLAEPKHSAAAPTALLADGLVAEATLGEGRLVVAGVDPTVFHDEFRRETSAQSLAFAKVLRICNTLLGNLGARSGEPLLLRPLKREAEWRLAFSDDFASQESAKNWRGAGRDFKIANRWMDVAAKDGGRHFVLFHRALADFRLEATVRVAKPGSPLLLLVALDYQDSGDYYLLQFAPKGFLFNNMVDGGWGKTFVGPDDPVAKLADAEPHRLELECVGSRVTVKWDGALAAKSDGIVRKQRVENAVAQQNGYVGFGSYYNPVLVSKVRIYEPAAGVAAVAAGHHTPIDLRKACTVGFTDETADDKKGGWFDSGEADLRMLPHGRQTLGGVAFDIIVPADNGGRSCVVLKSGRRPDLPKETRAAIGGHRARTLYFLHGGGWGSGHLATYTVVYADGSKTDVPIRMDKEVGDWYAPFGTQWGGEGSAKRLDPKVCCIAWEGPTPKFDSAGLYAFAWPNPHPEKPIRELIVTSAEAQGLVGLVAVTLSDAEPDLHPIRARKQAREAPQEDFVPTALYRAVADRWGYNPDRFRQW
ncbi:MAG TPA: hypothetical protein VNE39_10700 [Planctomycetota bacterium]|nr:hypothetical protein [Planctomycetota bacterium]